MQCDSSRVDNINQHLPITQPLHGTENTYQSDPKPPPYTQYSQQSLNGIHYTPPTARQYDETSLCQEQDAVVISAGNLLVQKHPLIIITSKLRAYFIISGIGYLFLGAGVIGLETSIIMYASSLFYRGIWTGCIMIGAGVSMLTVAYRVSHPIIYTIHLLIFVGVTITLGTALSVFEITGIQACIDDKYSSLCDKEIGKTLKLIIIGELVIALFYTSVTLSYAWNMKIKSQPAPPTPPTTSYEY